MSIWGTLIGGMLGFTIGGPIGALLGSFLGSKFSGGKVKSINFSNENSQQIFALALIILSAKISKADGVVTKDELLAVKEKLNIPDSEIDNVSKVFNVAKQDDLGFEPYAQQISQIYSKNKTALVEVLNILLYCFLLLTNPVLPTIVWLFSKMDFRTIQSYLDYHSFD